MDRKLDLSGVRVYTNAKCDIIAAIDLIGEEVYLSDDENFESYRKGHLLEVKYANDIIYPFLGGYEVGSYKYFILAKDAKFIEEKPKKLRPFTSTYEFAQVTGCNIGDVITIRRIDRTFEESCVVNGYRYVDTGPSTPHCVYTTLGSDKYTFEELLQYFKYRKNDEWYPFGVEE
jgi:hypothetical protein